MRWLQRQAAAAESAERAPTGAQTPNAARDDEGWSEGQSTFDEAIGSDDAARRGAAITACDAREAAAAWREQAEARVEALLDELDAARYLSEERFIESRIHARQARFGNRRIEQELREHGLKPAAEDMALLRQSERARARQVLQQRFADSLPEDLSPADRLRRTRFLAARGFSFEAIQAALRLPED